MNEDKHNILDVKSKVYDCGWCKKYEDTLEIPWKIYASWLFLLNEMEKNEWGGVFDVKDKKLISFEIPKQIVTSSEVEFQEDITANGVVHSHHDMGAFHSSQDDKQLRNLYEYSIVVSKSGHTACRRAALPCGGFAYIDLKLKVVGNPHIDTSNIEEKKYGFQAGYQAAEYGWIKDADDNWKYGRKEIKEKKNKKGKGKGNGHEPDDATVIELDRQTDADTLPNAQEVLDSAIQCKHCSSDVTLDEIYATEGVCPFCFVPIYTVIGGKSGDRFKF